PFLADQADTALGLDHRVHLGRRNAVAPLQVVMARAAVEPRPCLPSSRVVARLAVRRNGRSGPRKVGEWFDVQAVGTAPERGIERLRDVGLRLFPLGRKTLLVGGSTAKTVALAAVGAPTVFSSSVDNELGKRFPIAAVGADLSDHWPPFCTYDLTN